MAQRFAIPLSLLLSTLILPPSVDVRAQEIIVQETGDETAGGGAVIEIGGGGDDGSETETVDSGPVSDPEQPVNITRNPGNTGIEMIVGGQSEDGVAKRSNLPVVE